MKAREELRRKVWTTVTHDGYSLKDKANIIEKHCNQLAIGRWVSVEERLPDASQYFYIKINGEPEGGCWFDPSIREFDQREPKVSHWLELDMPSGKEGEG